VRLPAIRLEGASRLIFATQTYRPSQTMQASEMWTTYKQSVQSLDVHNDIRAGVGSVDALLRRRIATHSYKRSLHLADQPAWI
jgi:hypothetical protein